MVNVSKFEFTLKLFLSEFYAVKFNEQIFWGWCLGGIGQMIFFLIEICLKPYAIRVFGIICLQLLKNCEKVFLGSRFQCGFFSALILRLFPWILNVKNFEC